MDDKVRVRGARSQIHLTELTLGFGSLSDEVEDAFLRSVLISVSKDNNSSVQKLFEHV